MKIYNIETAKQTILKRKALNRMDYSPITIQKTEEFFDLFNHTRNSGGTGVRSL